jgi:hypothetical protein
MTLATQMEGDRERYQRYLCGREWGLLKEAVRKRCNGICERCHANPMDHVHHLTYVRKYRELLEDLQAQCVGCHEFTHGKRDRDPALDAPPMLWGNRIDTVYLAGRISGGHGNWRSEILPGWTADNGRGGVPDWHGFYSANLGGKHDRVPLPDGRTIGYAGPFWKDIWSGHGGGLGPHAFGDADYEFDGHGTGSSTLVDPGGLAWACMNFAKTASLFFAWLDSRDCIGTLVEIGAAHDSVCVVASPKWDRELWLPCAIADRFIVADTAGKAWEWLWKNPALTHKLGAVRDTLGPSEYDR